MASAARSAIPAAPLIGRLRQKLRATERATGLGECAPALALGIPEIDAALGGGLIGGALHEIAAAGETEITVATGFALALAGCIARQARDANGTGRLMVRDAALRAAPHHEAEQTPAPRSPLILKSRAIAGAACVNLTAKRGVSKDEGTRATFSPHAGKGVLWIAEDLSLAESGAPYGPGLDAAGLAPERLITVAAARGRDVLWAMEEALRCRAVGLVIGELRARDIDQVATRRLALAAAAGNTLGLLLRPAPDDEPCPAATRWIVGAAASFPSPHGIGPPRLAARLVRNRRGHLGTWIVEWDSVEQRFVLAAHSELVAFTALDQPHQAAMA